MSSIQWNAKFLIEASSSTANIKCRDRCPLMQSSLALPQTLLKFWWRYCCIGHPSLTYMNSPNATISYSKLWSLLWFIHDNLKWAAKLHVRIHLIHLHHLWNLNSGTYQRNNYAGITATGSTQFLNSVYRQPDIWIVCTCNPKLQMKNT